MIRKQSVSEVWAFNRSRLCFGCPCGSETSTLAGRVLFWVLLPPEMVSQTVIWVGYQAQLMVPYGARSLVVTMSGHDSHSSMFWVFYRFLYER